MQGGEQEEQVDEEGGLGGEGLVADVGQSNAEDKKNVNSEKETQEEEQETLVKHIMVSQRRLRSRVYRNMIDE